MRTFVLHFSELEPDVEQVLLTFFIFFDPQVEQVFSTIFVLAQPHTSNVERGAKNI
jgi:hypothetical protein